MKNNFKKQKVFVGLSGGVDSAVSLLLLKKAGYEVFGVFIKTWTPDYIECTQKEDRRDAMRVCASLGLPFIDLDLEKEYKKQVIDYFLKEYKNNRVPNPDIMCNKYIKFKAFYNFAKKNQAKIATGHYTQIKNNFLVKAKDATKDQIYFLYQINKDILSNIIFPIGHLKKKKVFEIARKNNLPVFNKKESMGICMLGGNLSPKEFLLRELKPKKGKVLDEIGNIIGDHNGVILYTIGERHGFRIFNTTNHSGSYYVVKKDLEKNILRVKSFLQKDTQFQLENKIINNIFLSHVNLFITEKELEDYIYEKKVFDFQFRYHGELIKGFINKFVKNKNSNKDSNKNLLEIILEKNISTQAGQSSVFYLGDVLIGGGIIK